METAQKIFMLNFSNGNGAPRTSADIQLRTKIDGRIRAVVPALFGRFSGWAIGAQSHRGRLRHIGRHRLVDQMHLTFGF